MKKTKCCNTINDKSRVPWGSGTRLRYVYCCFLINFLSRFQTTDGLLWEALFISRQKYTRWGRTILLSSERKSNFASWFRMFIVSGFEFTTICMVTNTADHSTERSYSSAISSFSFLKLYVSRSFISIGLWLLLVIFRQKVIMDGLTSSPGHLKQSWH